MKFLSGLFNRPSTPSNSTSYRDPCLPRYDLLGSSLFNGTYKLDKILEGFKYDFIYEVIKIETGEVFACKPMYGWQADDEAKLHQSCSRVSKHVAKVRGLQVVEEWPYTYMITDIYRGGDLYRQISKNRHTLLNDETIKEIFNQILDGVEDCHRIGVFLRNLEPENILFKEHSNEIVITEFRRATKADVDMFPPLDNAFAAPGTAVCRILFFLANRLCRNSASAPIFTNR